MNNNIPKSLSIFVGITANIYGSTMVDLSKIYGVSLKVTSNILIANSFGYMAGTLIGWTYKWLNRQLIIAIFSLVLAVANSLLPCYDPIWVAFVGMVFSGIGMGVLGGGANIWLIDMWPVGTTAVLQAGQFMYGLGTISAPILVSKFIYGEANVTESGEVLTVELRRTYLLVPYLINGVVQAVPPFILLILFFINRYRFAPSITPRKSIDFSHRNSIFEMPNLSKLQNSKTSMRKSKLTLGCLCYAMYFTAEVGYFPYASTMWQYLEIKLSAAEAASLMSVLSAAYTIGPVVTAFVSMKIKVDNIISYHFVFLLIGVSVLYFGQMSKTVIYIGSAVLGYGMSAMIPGINAFVNCHLTMSNRVAALYSFVSGTISMSIPLVIGPFLQTHPQMLIYLTASFIVLALILFINMRIWLMCSNSK